MEALERELPSGTIRYSSKVVSVEESGLFKLVYLADGAVFKTKVKKQLNLFMFLNIQVTQWYNYVTAAILATYVMGELQKHVNKLDMLISS